MATNDPTRDLYASLDALFNRVSRPVFDMPGGVLGTGVPQQGQIGDGNIQPAGWVMNADSSSGIATVTIDNTGITILNGKLQVSDSAGTVLIQDGIVQASAIQVGLTEGLLSSWSTDGRDASIWTNWNGAGVVSSQTVSDAKSGATVIRVAGGMGWLIGNQNIPYDPDSLYRVHVRVRQVSGATNTQVYAGVAGVAADGVTLVNISGVNTFGSQHYITQNSVSLTAGDGWHDYVGYLSGTAATGAGTAHPDSANPGALHQNARFIRPLILVNYSGGTGTAEIDFMSIQRIDNTGIKNSTGYVTIDSSGITINNGALTFSDQFGSNVLTGAGFGQPWVDFIANGFYNGSFANGTTNAIASATISGTASTDAAYLASLSSDVPYWIIYSLVNYTSGHLTRVADSTAPGAYALKFAPTAVGEQIQIAQDVPITPNQFYDLYAVWRYTNTTASFTPVWGYQYRDKNHAAIGSVIEGGLVISSTRAAYATDLVLSLDQAPPNARYVRIFAEIDRTTGSPQVWLAQLFLRSNANIGTSYVYGVGGAVTFYVQKDVTSSNPSIVLGDSGTAPYIDFYDSTGALHTLNVTGGQFQFAKNVGLTFDLSGTDVIFSTAANSYKFNSAAVNGAAGIQANGNNIGYFVPASISVFNATTGSVASSLVEITSLPANKVLAVCGVIRVRDTTGVSDDQTIVYGYANPSQVCAITYSPRVVNGLEASSFIADVGGTNGRQLRYQLVQTAGHTTQHWIEITGYWRIP